MPPWLLALCPGLLALSLASALASGLSDEESDRAGGKHTVATTLGNAVTRRCAEVLLVLGAALWSLAPLFSGPPAAALVPAVAVVAFFTARTVRRSPSAVTRAFAAQNAYKLEMHRAIWFGSCALAVAVLIVALVGRAAGGSGA